MRALFGTLLVLSVGPPKVLGLTKTAVMGRIDLPTVPSNFSQPVRAGKSEYSCKLLCLETAGCDLSIFEETTHNCELGNVRNWNALPIPTEVTAITSQAYFNSGKSVLGSPLYGGISLMCNAINTIL